MRVDKVNFYYITPKPMGLLNEIDISLGQINAKGFRNVILSYIYHHT